MKCWGSHGTNENSFCPQKTRLFQRLGNIARKKSTLSFEPKEAILQLLAKQARTLILFQTWLQKSLQNPTSKTRREVLVWRKKHFRLSFFLSSRRLADHIVKQSKTLKSLFSRFFPRCYLEAEQNNSWDEFIRCLTQPHQRFVSWRVNVHLSTFCIQGENAATENFCLVFPHISFCRPEVIYIRQWFAWKMPALAFPRHKNPCLF